MIRLATVHPATTLKRTIKGKKPAAVAAAAPVDELRGAALPATSVNRGSGGDGDLKSAVKAPGLKGQSGRDEGVDDEDDSDYDFEAECEDAGDDELSEEDSEEEDKDEHRRSLEAELDECADEGPDFYLKRMLAEREQLDGDDAAWVDRYIALQQAWKEQHAYSIDAFDLDAKVLAHTPKPKKKKKLKLKTLKKKFVRKGQPGAARRVRRPYAAQLRAFWRFWYAHVAPLLPLQLQHEPAEYVVALFAVIAFIVLSLVTQVYVALRAAPNLATE